MKIYELKERIDFVPVLMNIWEASVRATHLFLSDAEINHIKAYVPEALKEVRHLIIADDESGIPIAFMGIENNRLEMLFLSPEERGKGIGKKLIQYGIENYGIQEVTVNEQNPQAVGFYEHIGFVTYKRTDYDEEGNPYPLLYMRLSEEYHSDKKQKINFAVIGTNVITDTFLEAAEKVPGFHLKGVYSRSIEKAKNYAGKHGANLTFDDLSDLAASKEIDAVYIASPNSLHASQTIQMLNGGKHVLCEKSIASNQYEFEEMEKAALKNRKVLLEAMRSVYSPGFAAIQENLSKLGTIRRASFQYCQYSRRYDNFKKGIIENAFNPELSNGALMDIGVYCVHPMVALFGMPEKIISNSMKLENGVEAQGTILLQYEGMQGECIYSKIANSKIPSQIQGENATMVIREIPNPQNIEIYYRDGREEHLDIQESLNNMHYEVQEFIRLIEYEEVEHPYMEYSRMEMQLMDEVRRQQEIVFPADGEIKQKNI